MTTTRSGARLETFVHIEDRDDLERVVSRRDLWGRRQARFDAANAQRARRCRHLPLTD